jgi:hypothetical protein
MGDSRVAQMYMQESQKPRSNDSFVIYVLFAYSVYHGADHYGKQRVRCIMRYLLSAELILTLVFSDDVSLPMLVVRIMVLICAFFNEELIPTLTKMMWTMVCDNAPKVWQWLREQWHLWRPHAAQHPAQAQAPAQHQGRRNVRGKSPARTREIEQAQAYLRGLRHGRSTADPPDKLRQATECSVCLENRDLFVILPCRHRCVCEECAATLTQGCPICRTPIDSCIRVYDP